MSRRFTAISASRGTLARAAAVLLFYTAASALLIGRHALADPSHVCACIGGGDPPTYMWALHWWPYALTHGLNPLYTHLVWSPTGANVAASTAIPLASIVLWPVTAIFGALPAYDALTILSPAVAATAMYFLCEHITGRRLPALVGGWLFGFSSYELSQLVGHANLMLIALLPLAVLVVLLRLERRLRRRAFLAIMSALITAQLLTSTEVLLTSCAFGALALGLAWLALSRDKRAAVAEVTVETVGAGLIAALITSPYLYYSLIPARPGVLPGSATTLVTDLAGLVVPSGVTLVRYASGTAAQMPGNVAEQGAYFGIPLIAVFGTALWARRRTPAVVLLGGVAALALLLSFGSRLSISGHETLPLPWKVVAHIPIAKAAIPDRVVLYAWFALAVAVALWLATPSRWHFAKWALVIVGIAAILPDGSSPLFSGRPDLPALFTGQRYKRELPSGSMVLVLPYAYHGNSMLWQAETNFAFRMPEGYLTAAPAPFKSDRTVNDLLAYPPVPISVGALGRFIRRYRVTRVVVDALAPGPWPGELGALGLEGRSVEGAIVYRVNPG